MSQDLGSCCAKYILCLFNFIFFVSINHRLRTSAIFFQLRSQPDSWIARARTGSMATARQELDVIAPEKRRQSTC